MLFHGKALIPAGATIRGRIRRMEQYTGVGGFFTLGFEFTDIETAGISTRFFASFETAVPPFGFEWSMSSGTSRTDIINGDRITQIERESVQALALPGVGTLFMRGAHFEIPKGWKMVWKSRGSGPWSAQSYLAEEGPSCSWIPLTRKGF